jgi:crossover junction endodeoxyribonuclease RuvC
MSTIIAVDPGKKGAYAFYDPYAGQLEIFDMPVVERNKKSELDIARLVRAWSIYAPTTLILERVHSMPRQGVASAFDFGRTFGATEAAAIANGHTVIYVAPQQWKHQVGLVAANSDAKKDKKKASRQLAIETFPNHANKFKRAMDDGRAEAALMAWWYAESENHTITNP